MPDTTEPTNEALIDDLDAKRYQYENGEIDDFTQIAKAKTALRARLANLTERAEKAEATMERLGLVEDVTFDAADNSVSEWKNIRAEAAEAELAEMQKSDGWATVTSARDALVKIIGDGYAERSIMPAVGRVERIVSHLKAELARTREALTWAMDEIDELANVACGFAYPQAMTIIGRKSQSDSYFAACTARRAALAKPEPADG